VNVLVFEPHANGHHGPYLQWMATGLVERGFKVTVVTLPESLAHPSMLTLEGASQAHGRANLRLIGADDLSSRFVGQGSSAGLAVRELAYWRLFRAWYRTYAETVRPNVVFLPYLDYCLYAIGLIGSPFGGRPWVGVAMRPSFHYRQMGVIAPRTSLAALKKALFFRLLRNWSLRCLLTIDEPLCQYLVARPALAAKVAFLPEPAEFTDLPDRNEAKHRLDVPVDRKLVLVYGAVTARKGVRELLRALANPSFPPSVDVLLAGTISPEIHQALADPTIAPLVDQGRVRLLDRFIETREEPLLFSAADIVWLGYRGHYTASGVLVQAANAGRPVIACDEGIIGWQTRRHGLGEAVKAEDPAAVCTAIDNLLQRLSAQSVHAEDGHPFRKGFTVARDTLVAAITGSVTDAIVDAPYAA
jgi:glycosyltransferase involved in cell wall biosynthesis